MKIYFHTPSFFVVDFFSSEGAFQHEEHLLGIGLFSLTWTTGYKSDFRLQIQFPDSAQQRMDFECQCLYIVDKQFDDLLESLRPS